MKKTPSPKEIFGIEEPLLSEKMLGLGMSHAVNLMLLAANRYEKYEKVVITDLGPSYKKLAQEFFKNKSFRRRDNEVNEKGT